MGFLDRYRKEEKLHIDPSSRQTEWIPVKRKPERKEIQELTREEQMEPKRVHPWQTPRGKSVIKKIGGGVKRIDQAVVAYNRRRPIARGPPPPPSYSTHNNFNPFGSMFDTGMTQPTVHKKKKTSKTKYTIVGGKAYPIIGTGKKSRKKRRKKSKSRNDSWDRFNAFGGYKL